ncbi:hypothetical protein BaRGS_00037225, partial [Batillaria attramentaria]
MNTNRVVFRDRLVAGTTEPISLLTLHWTAIGKSIDLFSFSNVQLNYREAVQACADVAGDVRLASDYDIYSVVGAEGYLVDHYTQHEFWITASSLYFEPAYVRSDNGMLSYEVFGVNEAETREFLCTGMP